MKFMVTVPGSTANLGPGFDVFSLAVNKYVQVSNNGENEPCDSNHIADQAYRKAGGTGNVWFSHRLEPGRGLGFSAAARVGGVAIAKLEAGLSLTDTVRKEIYEQVLELEGHGDNAAASTYGGLTLVCNDEPFRLSAKMPGQILLWISREHGSTNKSRAGLSEMMKRTDAVFTVAQASLSLAALYEQDVSLVQKSFQDIAHQPERFQSIPTSLEAYEKAQELGCLAAWLSGAGPSIAMLVKPEDVDKFTGSMPQGGYVYVAKTDQQGLVLE